MKEITLYFRPDGRIVMRFPKGYIPDRATLERVSEIISTYRREAVA